jgi:predicted ribosome quality control (RQC) complex YloA/Tae2 family protein
MAIDSLTLTAALRELERDLVGARTDKIQQPERDVFILTMRTQSGNRKLLVSAGTGSARVHFTTRARDNPASPPMFCMLLRKHLSGAKVVAVEQPYLERACSIVFEATDQVGRTVERRLVIEMMGKTPNVVLCGEDGRIIDCVRKVDSDMSEKRQLLPGLFYRDPPSDGKADLFSMSEDDIAAALAGASGRASDLIRATFSGFSPMMSREAAFRCFGGADEDVSCAPHDAAARLKAFADEIKSASAPYILFDGDEPVDISCVPILQYGPSRESRREPNFSVMLDKFYTGGEIARRTAQRAQSMVRTITNLRDRTARKLLYQAEELRETEDRESFRRAGDIIQANLYRIKRGDTTLTAEDFYAEEPAETVIPLDPKLSPHKNAEKYYKKYAKAKNARIALSEQMREGEKELAYLESVLEELSRAMGEKDLEEIRAELVEGGYIRENDKKKNQQTSSAPYKFTSSTGVPISVGKNNRQNDNLTFKTAFRGDTWLHAQKIHGAHVIITSDDPDGTTLLEAAALAAYFSQGRDAGAVDVDYTKARNVKKPSGSKPGMVIYTDYKTLRVRPSDALKFITDK